MHLRYCSIFVCYQAVRFLCFIVFQISTCLFFSFFKSFCVVPLFGVGFYHSGILNTHDVCGEPLWELANRSYTSFENAKKNKKHFTDMADLNFLMNKAIENPHLTPSSSLRTALMSVFEEPIIDESNQKHQDLGLEDYICCPSVHGVSPSIAIFDTIQDGSLSCVCVYPSPLHSREQMQDLVDHMKRLLLDGCKNDDELRD